MGHARAWNSTYHRCKCFDCRRWRHVFLHVSDPPVYVFCHTGIDSMCDLDNLEIDICAPFKHLGANEIASLKRAAEFSPFHSQHESHIYFFREK